MYQHEDVSLPNGSDIMKNVDSDPNIVRSPNAEVAAKLEIPNIPLTTFLFDSLHRNQEFLKDKTLIINVVTEESIRFDEIERLSKQFASALTRMGFKKGDVLYYVTYDTMYLFVVQLGVWLCGGAVRGCFQKDESKMYERQMREVFSRFILIEKETVDAVKSAAQSLEWEVQFLSVGGEVDGATPIEDMIFKDDGSALPMNVHINPKEDVLYIPSTSGSSGVPKGVLHTHYTILCQLASCGLPADLKRETRFGRCSLLCLANFSGVSFSRFYYSLMIGETYINIPKFDGKTFLGYIEKYKPDSLHFFPYITSWMVHSAELDNYDLSSVKRIVTAGSVLPVTLLKTLTERLPRVRIYQVYGMTEVIMISTEDSWQCAEIESPQDCETLGGLKLGKINNETHVTCGFLTPLAEAKIVSIETGKSVGRGFKGKLLVRVPYHMKGYIRKSIKEYDPNLDADGFFDTGDIAFFDNDGHLYLVERLKSVFKYYAHHVYPSEIETLINDHPAVSNSAVVAVPDITTSNLARAYVVLKPGFQVTEEDIKEYVARNAVSYKHLHGGVAFLEKLPETRSGKIDKTVLLQRAIEELKSTQ